MFNDGVETASFIGFREGHEDVFGDVQIGALRLEKCADGEGGHGRGFANGSVAYRDGLETQREGVLVVHDGGCEIGDVEPCVRLPEQMDPFGLEMGEQGEE